MLAGVLAWSPAAQGDLRRLVGAALVGQVGFTLFGLVAGSQAGFCGALAGTLAGRAGALLALGAAGLIADRLGSADPAGLAGLARQRPRLYPGAGARAGLCSGLPPLGGFPGRLLIFQAATLQGPGWPWVVALGVGLALLAAASCALWRRSGAARPPRR